MLSVQLSTLRGPGAKSSVAQAAEDEGGQHRIGGCPDFAKLGGSFLNMDKPSPYFSNLKCRECGKLYAKEAIHVCDYDFGRSRRVRLRAIRSVLTREVIEARPRSMWRYRELLPIDGRPTVGTQVGFTPLIRADRLAESARAFASSTSRTTRSITRRLSFKDRVVSVALSRARELGFKVVACASTGNLGEFRRGECGQRGA
jgi:threonine synthase